MSLALLMWIMEFFYFITFVCLSLLLQLHVTFCSYASFSVMAFNICFNIHWNPMLSIPTFIQLASLFSCLTLPCIVTKDTCVHIGMMCVVSLIKDLVGLVHMRQQTIHLYMYVQCFYLSNAVE